MKLTLDEVRSLLASVPEPPWFAADDEANECGPHKQSGLALVDTGRSEDWPIARLCHWPVARFIAASPSIARLAIEQGEEIKRLREALGGMTTLLLQGAYGEAEDMAQALDLNLIYPPKESSDPRQSERIDEEDLGDSY